MYMYMYMYVHIATGIGPRHFTKPNQCLVIRVDFSSCFYLKVQQLYSGKIPLDSLDTALVRSMPTKNSARVNRLSLSPLATHVLLHLLLFSRRKLC